MNKNILLFVTLFTEISNNVFANPTYKTFNHNLSQESIDFLDNPEVIKETLTSTIEIIKTEYTDIYKKHQESIDLFELSFIKCTVIRTKPNHTTYDQLNTLRMIFASFDIYKTIVDFIIAGTVSIKEINLIIYTHLYNEMLDTVKDSQKNYLKSLSDFIIKYEEYNDIYTSIFKAFINELINNEKTPEDIKPLIYEYQEKNLKSCDNLYTHFKLILKQQ